MINRIASIRGLRSATLATALLAGSVLSAAAATVTFDFTNTTKNAGAGTATGSGVNNQRVYSAGGITLTVTAFSTTGSGGTLARANVGWHGSAGLGVCNASEITSCGSPTHQADNVGAQDFVLFQFSMPVDPTTVRIQPYGDSTWWTNGNEADRDVRYYVNSAALALTTINGSLPSAVGTVYNDYSSVSDSARNVTIAGGASVRTLLFGTPSVGASLSSTPDSLGDFFKIHSLVVEYVSTPGGAGDPVPAPGALALLGSALAGLAISRRRRV